MLTPALAQSLVVLGITPEMLQARGLQPHAEADSLSLADTGADGREFMLQPMAAAAWQAMKQAAAAEDVAMQLVSAFRSVGRQEEILRAKLAGGQSIEQALRVVAAPGYSEHHTGLAIDIATPEDPELDEDFEATPAFAWLRVHAAAYGFHMSYPRGNAHGYAYEPWHWCFREA
jgi:D-alanyl-D-alanine carboxypeptidase